MTSEQARESRRKPPPYQQNWQNRLISRPNAPKVPMMRSRVILGLILGVVGIGCGVAGVVLALPVLALLAAVFAVAGCSVIAATSILPLLKRANETDDLRIRIDAVMGTNRYDTAAPVPLDHQSVIDPVTHFPDIRFFEVAVAGRVASARRHLWPVSIVLLQLGFDSARDTLEARNKALVGFSAMMRHTLREADIACRLDERTFGLILEDTSEEGGVWTVERLQIALSHDVTHIRRLVAGVAAYPTHGLASADVLARAQAALSRASSAPAGHGLGQVEVAHVDLS